MFRDILKKSGTYSIATLASRSASFLLLPVYTRVLTPSDYGVMELLDVAANVVGLLLGTRIGQALFYFYFAAKREEDRQACVTTAFAAAGMMGACCGTIALIGAARLSTIVFGDPAYASYVRLVLITFGVSIPVEVGYCYLRARGEASRYVCVTVANLGVSVILMLALLIEFHQGVRGVLISGLTSGVLLAVYLSWHALGSVRAHVDWSLLVRLVRYSFPLGISGLAVFFIHYGDRMFLRPRVTLAELGVYSLAYKFGMIIPSVHMPFILHWNAQVATILREPEGSRVYVRSFTYLAAGLTAVVVLMSVFIVPILSLMAGAEFRRAAVFVPLLATAYLIRAMGAHLQSVFIAEGRPGLEARINVVGSGACVSAYALLIPRFTLWGAVAATIIGFTVILIYGFYVAQRLRRFDFEYGRLMVIVLFAGITIVTYDIFCPKGLVPQCMMAALASLSFGVALLFGCFDSSERASARAVVRNARELLSRLHQAQPAEV